jgi:hypothetical protein
VNIDQEPLNEASRAGDRILQCSIRGAARRLGMSERAIREQIKAGVLAAERHGTRWIVLLPSALLAAETGREQSETTWVPAQPEGSSSPNSLAPRAKPEPTETPERVVPAELEQIIERASAQYRADLRTFGEELGRRMEDTGRECETLEASPGAREPQQGVPQAQAELASSNVPGPEASAPKAAAAPIPGTAQTQPGQSDQSRAYRAQLQAQHEGPHVLVKPQQEGPTRPFAYRLVFIFVLCAAILIAISILLLGNRRDGANDRGLGAPDVARTSALLVASAPALAVPSRAAPESQPSPHSKETPVNSQTVQPSGARTVAGPTAHPSFLPLTPTTASQPSPAATAPAATANPPSAQVLLQRVSAAEAALRTGQLEATIIYGSGLRSSARVRFDLGDAQHVPRFQITTTYEGTNGVQTTERITIGDQSWERQQDGHWTTTPARESALKQLQVFLPRTDSISNVTRVTVEGTYVLRWYDAARDADVTLRVDTAGIPQQLRRVSRANGLTRTVTYRSLNTPVEITPPEAT